MDLFKFAGITPTTPSQSLGVLISDLDNRETIDLSGIDASTAERGDQAFKLVEAFSGATRELVVVYDTNTGETVVEGDVNGDAKSDFFIRLTGDHRDFANFVL